MRNKIVLMSLLIFLSTLSSVAQTKELTVSLNNYSFDLYREIKVDNDNLFVSPLSTYLALMIAYEGARSETKTEFDKIFHIDNPDLLNGVNSFFSGMTAFKNSSNYLRISNAIWIQNEFKIDSLYKRTVRVNYSADVKSVDFLKKQAAISEINQWVTKKTGGLIKDIVGPNDITQSTRLMISNAVYFSGKWADEFNKELTRPDVFYSISKNIAQIEFMNKSDYLSYFENNEFQFVSIPYKGNDKSFCIILPRKRYGLSDIESAMGIKLLDSIFNNMEVLKVNLSIPKFKLETGYSLIVPLNRLGLKTAFTSKADFSGITKEEPLMIYAVNHKAYISIDEVKTEAGASTIVGMRTGSAGGPTPEPKVFKADHPFIFMIIDNETRGIIFIGRYVKP